MANPLIVGIDVHSRTNRTCLLDREGEPWGQRFSTANNRPGTQTLIGRLVEALQQGQFESRRVAVEATNSYWFPLSKALRHAPGTELRFREGAGTARVRIKTLNGDISVCNK